MSQRPTLSDRLVAAIPLLTLYFGLAALYAWQASRHPVPTIYSDEIELAWLSRSISETGEAARRGDPYGLATLVAYFLAPVWWVGSAATGYAAAKLLLVLAMTATVFPAYALARLVVPPWYALAAAGGATIVPALAYSPILVEEPLAYPLATLALWLIARVYVEPTWGRAGLAVLACAAAMLTRTQLSILFALFVLGLLWLCWQSERALRWRSSFSGWDWVGLVTLGVGAAVGASAFLGHLSKSWRDTTGAYPERIIEHAAWASGALAIGIGVLPLLAGIAALARPRGEMTDPKTRAFVITSVFALVVFVAYAGIKGAQISITFSTLVVERNLIYLCPILFAATALAFVRGVGRGWAIAGATVFTVYVVTEVPLRLDNYPYYEAHGLSLPAFLNREWGWPEGRIESTLLIACFVSVGILVALRYLRRGSVVFTGVAATAAVAVFAWTLTAEVYAAEGERRLARQIADNLPAPYDWVDRATGGGSVVVLGQQMNDDPTGVYLTEFFNRSVKKVWSTDGTAPGPGAILTPDLASADGTLTPSPETDYALTLNGVELQAPVVKRLGPYVLYDVDREALKLASGVNGIDRDGWIADTDRNGVAEASYNRFDVSRDGPGFARVNLSRVAWCSGGAPGKATVRIGPIGIGPDNQPAISRVTQAQTKTVTQCTATGFRLAAPNGPWRIEVEISPTFSPHDIDPNHSDRRQLGAVFTAGFQPLFGA
ncbi:MAG: hypothetical protein H0U30_07105 [Actinobacteria bacterium]|nr:hypothetical protein [Actinomycetota bacterium]